MRQKIASSSFTEEAIFVGEGFGTSTYALSNSLDAIEQAIFQWTKQAVDLDRVSWTPNANLSENVKKTMNQRRVTYSMTTATDNDGKYYIVNKKENGQWFSFGSYYEANNQRQRRR